MRERGRNNVSGEETTWVEGERERETKSASGRPGCSLIPRLRFLLPANVIPSRSLVGGYADPELQDVGRAAFEPAPEPVSYRSDGQVTADPEIVPQAAQQAEA
jgi:hypothetical protein